MSNKEKEGDFELNPEERLHMENEIDKLKRSAFHGADFSFREEDPPKFEYEWLEYLHKLETDPDSIKQVTIAERLGNPDFPSVEELSDEEIKGNLEKVLELMHKEGLCLETIAEVPDVELYRFITEDLFLEKVNDVHVEGLTSVFIYEEFYPNDLLDIEQTIDEFITRLFSKDFRDYLSHHLAEECRTKEGDFIPKILAVEKSLSYGDLFNRMTLDKLCDLEINIEENELQASAEFYIKYQAEASDKTLEFEGAGQATLCKGDLGYWNIVSIEIPGFSF